MSSGDSSSSACSHASDYSAVHSGLRDGCTRAATPATRGCGGGRLNHAMRPCADACGGRSFAQDRSAAAELCVERGARGTTLSVALRLSTSAITSIMRTFNLNRAIPLREAPSAMPGSRAQFAGRRADSGDFAATPPSRGRLLAGSGLDGIPWVNGSQPAPRRSLGVLRRSRGDVSHYLSAQEFRFAWRREPVRELA